MEKLEKAVPKQRVYDSPRFNRMLVLVAFMFLAGWLGWLMAGAIDKIEPVHVVAILAAVGGPVGTYIGIKGTGQEPVRPQRTADEV